MSHTIIERDRRNLLLGGLAGLGALSSLAAVGTAAATAARPTSPAGGKRRVKGEAPLMPALAKVLPASPELMSALATEFAPLAAQLQSQQTYWLSFNGWITDRLSGPVMEGKVSTAELGAQAWAVYASSVWGGIELHQNWGMPPLLESRRAAMPPPFTQIQQDVADRMTQHLTALASGGEACLKALPALLRVDSTPGIIFTMAYNAGVQVILTEDPPIGKRRPNQPPRPSAVRINPRDFMRVDYDLPTPHYLKFWRSKFEEAVAANPQEYEKIIVGRPGDKSLRDVWQHGVGFGNTTWAGSVTDKWSNGYFNDSLRWSSVLNFGLEAIALAAFVALIQQDQEAGKRAIMAHALYVGATSGWFIGLLDTDDQLPSVMAM
jgi:hypothetical protein